MVEPLQATAATWASPMMGGRVLYHRSVTMLSSKACTRLLLDY
jgi:hypothetical protein